MWVWSLVEERRSHMPQGNWVVRHVERSLMPQLKLKAAPLKIRTSPLYNWWRLLLASAILVKGLCQQAVLAFTPEMSTHVSPWPWWTTIYGISVTLACHRWGWHRAVWWCQRDMWSPGAEHPWGRTKCNQCPRLYLGPEETGLEGKHLTFAYLPQLFQSLESTIIRRFLSF